MVNVGNAYEFENILIRHRCRVGIHLRNYNLGAEMFSKEFAWLFLHALNGPLSLNVSLVWVRQI